MNSTIEKYFNEKTRVVWHITFWLAYLIYYVFTIGSLPRNNYTDTFLSQGLSLLPKIIVTYIVLYVLIPRYFITKKILIFSVFFALILLAGGIFKYFYDFYVINPLLYPERTNTTLSIPAFEILRHTLAIYPVVMLAAFIKLGKYWLEKDRAAQKIESEKVNAELKFLKAQIHPHFLFNTLNNLYALTLKKSDKAPEVVLKISDLLDYMLYESNTPTVPLKKELDLIESYIHLEKIRYGNKLRLAYDVKGDINGNYIPPLLILPFIENSFKHGVSQQLQDMWIDIKLEINLNRLMLKVDNSKSSDKSSDSPGADLQKCKDGIGLKNVKRRLELLYGKDYKLYISDEKENFSIFLSVSLDKPLGAEKE
ncbi:signal transduction histidine kinase [Flammeovirgaceae bacterium 311]|nr:signal transduction histidine kinase [Flammeovirgaceae bacterium 311]